MELDQIPRGNPAFVGVQANGATVTVFRPPWAVRDWTRAEPAPCVFDTAAAVNLAINILAMACPEALSEAGLRVVL